MKKIISLLFLTAILFSCTKPEKTELTVSDEKIVSVLTDLYLFQARLDYNSPADSNIKLTKKDIFEKNGISESTFDSTMKVLADYPVQLREIQTKSEEKIQEIQRKLSEINQKK